MESESGNTRTNGMAVAASVVVAGIVGTLASALFGRSESKREVAQRRVAERLEQLESGAGQAIDKLVTAAEGLNVPRIPDSRRAQRKARAAGKSASKNADSAVKATKSRISEIEREARKLRALEKANKLGHDGSKRASEIARQLSSRTSDLVDDNRADVKKLRARASRSAGKLRDRGSALADQARDAAPDARDKASKSASDALSRGTRAAHRARDQAPGFIDKAGRLLHEATDQGSSYAAQAREKGPVLRDKASKAAHDAVDHAREMAPDVRDKGTGIAHAAADRAGAFVDQARDKGPEVLGAVGAHVADALHTAQKQARPLLDEATSTATRAVEQVKDAGSHGHVQSAASSLSAIGSAATDRLAHTTDAIEHKSKSAATAAGRGTKESGALLAWTAAAAGLVYVTFLNDEQRKRVKDSGQRIFAEVKEVYRDIRGQDGEFK